MKCIVGIDLEWTMIISEGWFLKSVLSTEYLFNSTPFSDYLA